MKIKRVFCLLSVIFLLIGSGCSDNAAPAMTYDYDIEEAVSMIDEIEWLCAWLQEQDSLSRDDAEKFIIRLDETLHHEGENILTTAMKDAADWENRDLQTISLRDDCIQPTIYHEGVSVVSAIEERQCEISESTGECTAHMSYLKIRKEYTGTDEKLQDWYLEYVFSQAEHNGAWDFVSYNGTYNEKVHLPLTESFYTVHY